MAGMGVYDLAAKGKGKGVYNPYDDMDDEEPVSHDVHEVAPDDAKDGYMAVDPLWLEHQHKLMKNMPWFRHHFTRADASRDLHGQAQGAFLVRLSSQAGHYAISVNMGNKMENLLILPSWDATKSTKGETLYRLGTRSVDLFVSIPDLLQYYVRKPFYVEPNGRTHFFRPWRDLNNKAMMDAYMELRAGPIDEFRSGKPGYMDTKPPTNPHYMDPHQDQEYDVEGGKVGYRPVVPVIFDSDPYNNLGQSGGLALSPMGKDTSGYADVTGFDEEELGFGADDAPQDKNGSLTVGGVFLTTRQKKVYDIFWRQAEISGSGVLGPGDAVSFFRASGLDDQTLGAIWVMADGHKTGSMDKEQFFVAIKLVALVQQGIEPNVRFIVNPCELPDLGEHTEAAERQV